MLYHARPRGWLVIALVLLALLPLFGGCAGGAGDHRVHDTDFSQNQSFPLPLGLEPKVGFWRNVYGVWSRGEVAIHDTRHMGLVYEVIRLPGPIEESYTPAQREYIQALRERWSARLRTLQEKVVRAQPLDNNERALKQMIDRDAGASALFGAADRVRSQRGLRERFRRGLEVSGRFDAEFRTIFRRYGLPEDLAFLPHVESSFQLNARSSVGASGVWQFMPATARQYMIVNRGIDQRLDPIISADGAARYLTAAYARLGTWPLALTSYNHGVGGMARAKSIYGTDFMRIVNDYDGKYFGFASRNFYAEFLAARHVALNHQRYFPEGVRFDPPQNFDAVTVAGNMTATDIATRYRVPLKTLIDLNRSWLPPVRTSALPVPAGSRVWLPRGSAGRA